MVSTRSRAANKHEAPKALNDEPPKRQKTAKGAKKTKTKPAEEEIPKDEKMDVQDEKEEKQENGKPEATESEPAGTGKSASDEPSEAKETEPRKKDEKQDAGKPPGEEPEAAEAEKQTTGGAPRESSDAKSPILEKGIFYFFFRPRVNVENPTSINDAQKAYLLLRPTKTDADSAQKSLRMIQIPKKALPATGTHERFLGFVIATDENVKDLKNDIGEETYSTATRGERSQPAARPVAEGVYAIVGDPDGRTTHFVYMLTSPSKATEAQKEFGIDNQGSFVMSTRNPKTPAPPQARGLQEAKYPEKIMEQFRDRRWMNLLPEHLDYQFTQILFIGEKSSIAGNVEELEKLEEQDEARVNHLKGDDAVFKDLELSKKEFVPGALQGQIE